MGLGVALALAGSLDNLYQHCITTSLKYGRASRWATRHLPHAGLFCREPSCTPGQSGRTKPGRRWEEG